MNQFEDKLKKELNDGFESSNKSVLEDVMRTPFEEKVKKTYNFKAFKPAMSFCLVAVLFISLVLSNNILMFFKQGNVPSSVVLSKTGFNTTKDFDSYVKSIGEGSSTYVDRAQNFVFLPELMPSTNAFTSEPKAVTVEKNSITDFSIANLQEVGVDESDIVKTDGTYIYIISAIGNIKIVLASNLELVSTIEIDGFAPTDLYLNDGRIVVIGNRNMQEENPYFYNGKDAKKIGNGVDEKIAMHPYFYSTNVAIYVYDTGNITSPILYKFSEFENASLVSSRMIGGDIYLVLNNNEVFDIDGSVVIPKVSRAPNGVASELPITNVFALPCDANNMVYTITATSNINIIGGFEINAYLGSSKSIYISDNNVYSISENWSKVGATTQINRFFMDNGKLVYAATGKVAGTIVNEFALSEYEGVLRIATTDLQYNEKEVNGKTQLVRTTSNMITALDAVDKVTMIELSRIDGFGKEGEKIISVRFENDTCYLVTSQNSDLVYTIDLSNARLLTVTEQNSATGVSEYLQRVDGTDLMLGIGRRISTIKNQWEEVTRLNGIKVSLFDVSSGDPVEMEIYEIESASSYTEATYNHKAIMIFAPANEDFVYVAIPVNEFSLDYQTYSDNMYLFKVSQENGIEKSVALTHLDGDENNYFYDNIVRSLIIDDSFYTISQSKIVQYSISDNFSVLNQIEITN